MEKNNNTALINHARDFFSATGSPARALMKTASATGKMDTNVLRTNDVLRKDEWQLLDTTLVDIARQRLIGVGDLVSRGLTVNLGGLGITLSQFEKLSDMSAADVDFASVTDGEKDKVAFTLVSIPIPIIHKDFSLNLRSLEASRGPSAIGEALDTTTASVAAKKVVEQMEEILFNGYSAVSGQGDLDGNVLEGYTTHADVNTYGGADWGTDTNVEAAIIGGFNAIEADNYFGPKVVYAATTQYGQLRAFHDDGSGANVRTRALEIEGLDDIRPGDRLTAGTGVMVTMERDVIDWAIGQNMTVVEWETKGGFQINFKVLVAAAPRVKSDADSGSGIATLSSI